MVGRKWGLGRGNIVKWWLWVAGALLLLWEEFQFVDHEPCLLAGVGVPDGKPLLAEEAHFDVAHGACAAGAEGVAQASAVVVEVGGRVEELHLLPGAPAGAVDAP